ncbi:wnt inhibitory factor 1 isoform X3 [Bos indicus]|uniref:Wnt inhibitory factor 1 n=2 Tax=Bos TaxID=9903 RepID=A0A4W2ECB3_BOBOX
MARKSAFPAGALWLWSILPCLLVLRAEVGQQPEESLYLWIDAHQARVLIGLEEDILIVSEGKMAPFTHDFRRAQQRMPAIPVNIHSVNFTWQAAGQAEYFYEFLSLRSLDKGIMADPTVNVPLLGTVPHKASVLCSPRCMNGGLCVTPGFCICPPGFYGVNCDKANCSATCFNGGTCFYPGKCICPPGLEGEQCETSKCPQPCRNGGKCIGKNKCKCSKGYQGDLCSKPVCKPGCGTHGTCHEPNKCQCREGWHGRHCNKRYGASLLHTLRPAGAQLRQHTPSVKKAEERQDPPESNYIW